MPLLHVTARSGAPEETAADTRVVGLFEGESLADERLQRLVDLGEAKPGLKKVAVAHEDAPGGGQRRVLIAGLGKRGELDAERARVAAAAVAARAKELGAVSLSWAVPDGDGVAAGLHEPSVAAGLVEGTLLKLYSFDRFKEPKGDDNGGIESLEVVGGDKAEVEGARVAADAANAARDLQNLPSNFATPTFLAERAGEIADQYDDLELELLDGDAIVARGMGAFAAVAQGAHEDPRLIVLRYRPTGATGPHLAFVGKAVTFDTGGISIKPAAKMQEMKFDMSGGAAVIEATGAIARLGLPVTLTAVVPSTENMPSGHAVKPGDIVTALNGKTIEVNNTDAEGRLILADALAYAVEQGAERIVDLATLTGAVLFALGHTYAGLWSNDDAWFEQVRDASDASGEIGWRMPLHPEYFDLTKGTVADLQNAAEARVAQSNYAAEFLRQFVDDRPWVHVDIAGTAWGMSRNYVGKGASGFGTRMLIELARRAAS
ncbi:MAG: leucyl aminopeptidase [Thermoleophilaceae bacterium]|nr:leucyl aminopeptidase [Thermoleophilaceae bacterium]MEA2400649.1 leucyl aminopeptidase [Thermoleophilaceae bacterium]